MKLRNRLIIVFCLLILLGARSSAQTNSDLDDGRAKFDLSKIDASVVKIFEQAWAKTGIGQLNNEVVILLYRQLDGSYKAVMQNPTYEREQASFKWVPNAIAIIHTHPNNCPPVPSGADMQTADRLKRPIFTLTKNGMYMYDPDTKKIIKVKKSLDWLVPSKWDYGLVLARGK